MKLTEPPRRREEACFIFEGGKAYCIDPLDDLLDVLAKKWTMLIVGVLGNEREMRFNELKRALPGISARALSDRLADLVRLGLVERTIGEGNPPSVSYALTSRGREMRKALVPVLEWAKAGGAGSSL